MLKNKKIVFILLLFLILFFSFFNIVKASTGTITLIANISRFKGKELVFADFSDLVNPTTGAYIITSHSGKYHIYICPVEGAICYTPSYNCDFYWLDSDENRVVLNDYYYDGSSWIFNKTINRTEGNWEDTYYCSVDMYNTDGTLFFQGPIVEIPEEIPEVTLMSITKTIPLSETLQEIVQILPLIIVVVVSLVGLRKGLKLLSTLLHQA